MLPVRIDLVKIDLHRIDLHISSRRRMALKDLKVSVRASVKAEIDLNRADFKRMIVATVDLILTIEVSKTVKEAVSREAIILISRVAVKADSLIKRIDSRAHPERSSSLSLSLEVRPQRATKPSREVLRV